MPLALTPDLATACVHLSTGPGELCVIFPGGARVCAQFGYDTGDSGEIVKSMLGALNAALVPLGPFFDMLDLFKAIVDCIQAIPDSILSLNPAPIVNCIPHMVKAVDKLLALLPPFPIFVLVKGIVGVIITGLRAVQEKLRALIVYQVRLVTAATRASQLGNVQLQAAVDCATGNFDAQLTNMNTQFLPLNRLIGIINVLLELVGVDCIPTIGGIAGASQAAIDALDVVITFLETVAAAIPGGLPPLPALPPAGTC